MDLEILGLAPASLLVAVSLLVVGCHTAGPGASQGASPAASQGASLDGRTFLSMAVTENGAPRPLVPGTRLRLAFADGRIGASAGCNQLSAAYRLDGSTLVVDSLVTTDMGCDPQRHDQDGWLASFLRGRPTVNLSGDDLSLRRDATVIQLLDRRVADPDRPLVGPTWRLESLIQGQVVSSIPDGVAAMLVFGADGRVAIETGCNTGAATYTLEGDSIRLSGISLTKRACTGSLGEVEQAVLGVLQPGSLGYRIETSVLTLSAGDRGLGLRAE
jgi:heat shock protein HslJ